MGSSFSGCCRRLEALLLGGHTWQVVRIMVSRLQPSCHGGMGSLIARTVQLLQNSPHSFVNFALFVFDMDVLFMCCMCVVLVCTHADYMND